MRMFEYFPTGLVELNKELDRELEKMEREREEEEGERKRPQEEKRKQARSRDEWSRIGGDGFNKRLNEAVKKIRREDTSATKTAPCE